MGFLLPIYTEASECAHCYKCIRLCALKAIQVEDGTPQIRAADCVFCGNCVSACHSKAKRIRDDVLVVRKLFAKKKRVILSLAPSFISEFDAYTIEELVHLLKKCGFYAVSETALGADFIINYTRDYIAQKLQNDEQKLFLSTCCPSAVKMIKMLYPDFAPYLVATASPAVVHARLLQKLYGEDVAVVYAGPCITEKFEADIYPELSAALTFSELATFLDDVKLDDDDNFGADVKVGAGTGALAGATFATQTTLRADTDASASSNFLQGATFATSTSTNGQNAFVPESAGRGVCYGVAGGIASICSDLIARAFALSGFEEITQSLQGLNVDAIEEPLFLELSLCHGGCVYGFGQTNRASSILKKIQNINYSTGKNYIVPAVCATQNISLSRSFPAAVKKVCTHTDKDLREALHFVGKYTPRDELNCGCCGYDTCRQFATAVLEGRANKDMCVLYMSRLAQNKASALMQAMSSGVVVADKNLIIKECNEHFANLVGAKAQELFKHNLSLEGEDLSTLAPLFSRFFTDVIEDGGPDVIKREIRDGKRLFHISVFVVEKGFSACAIIDDVSSSSVQKHRVITQAEKVREKNLAVVQQIAFLLGENAAETEAILNSIIESFANTDDDTKSGGQEK